MNELDIKRALLNALTDCKIPEAGCGAVEYRIDGNALFERVKGIADIIPGDPRKASSAFDPQGNNGMTA